MRTGIDETGSFNRGSFGYLAAVHIRAGRTESVRELHQKWEHSIPVRGRSKGGEVKGAFLTNDEQYAFVNDVLLASWPDVRYTAVGVLVDEHALKHAEFQRSLSAEQLDEGIALYIERDGPKSKTANLYHNLLGWWKNLRPETVLRVSALGELVAKSLAFVVPYSAAHAFDDELDQIAVLIDDGLWSSHQKVVFWKDMLRSHLWTATWRSGGVPVVNEWTMDHPFYKAFVEQRQGERLVLKSEFKDRIGFFNSEANFEVRLADVCAAIIPRILLQSDQPKMIRAMNDLHSELKGICNLLAFTEERSSVPNPYIQ